MADETSDYLLPVWLSESKAGHSVCLVTLIAVEGSSPRPLGSQIIVSTSGHCIGYITGGCAEAAIKVEALDVIKSGKSRMVRYGEGSPYKDIILPCGSGLDILFSPNIDYKLIQDIHMKRTARKPVALSFNLANGQVEITKYASPVSSLHRNHFYRPYAPQTRLEIIGKGPVVLALAHLADLSGFDISVSSPETDTLSAINSETIHTTHILKPQEFIAQTLDKWTACALLFHDHDWEYPILDSLLKSEAFFIGALGSRKTQTLRAETLLKRGVTSELIDRLHAPIGIDIQASTPNEIAISILSEIIMTYRTGIYGPARW